MKKLFFLLAFLPSIILAREIPVSNAIIEDNTFVWEVIAVDFRDDCTIIHKEVTPKVSGTWICSTTDEFIEDAATQQRYYLLYSTIGLQPIEIYHTNTISFTEIYPPVKQLDLINIHSGKYYYKKGISVWPFYTSYPYVAANSDHSYANSQIVDVTITDALTFVAIDYYSYYPAGGWISFASNMYITDNNTFRANIMGVFACDNEGDIVEAKNLDEQYDVNKGERNRIMLVFPRIPTGIHEVDVIEPNGFFWRGIKINNVD